MMFRAPQVNLYVGSLEISREFYEKIGFRLNFTAEIRGKAVHYELVLDGFVLGLATRESAKSDHGLNPGRNAGCELVLWTDNTDRSVKFLLENGGRMLSQPHTFLEGKLRVGWVLDPDDNPIQIVSKVESQ